MIVTFVCTGNTCRSPMAQHLMAALIEENSSELKFDIQLFSAGTNVTDDDISAMATKALKKLGIAMTSQNTKKINITGILQSDFVFTMENSQKNHIVNMIGADLANGKIYSFGDIVGKDISDPYGKNDDEYLICAKEIKAGVKQILEFILKKKQGF